MEKLPFSKLYPPNKKGYDLSFQNGKFRHIPQKPKIVKKKSTEEMRLNNKNQDDLWLENISLNEAMKRLNAREKHILTLRFFAGKTQMEVADEIGISQAQVSRLEKTALKHMKKYI